MGGWGLGGALFYHPSPLFRLPVLHLFFGPLDILREPPLHPHLNFWVAQEFKTMLFFFSEALCSTVHPMTHGKRCERVKEGLEPGLWCPMCTAGLD